LIKNEWVFHLLVLFFCPALSVVPESQVEKLTAGNLYGYTKTSMQIKKRMSGGYHEQ